VDLYPFIISKNYAEELQNKISVFKQETGTRKSVFLTMITTMGIKSGSYYSGLVQNELKMDTSFADC
jgi:uncharacterized protein